jgi:hypothetical protein
MTPWLLAYTVAGALIGAQAFIGARGGGRAEYVWAATFTAGMAAVTTGFGVIVWVANH